MKINQLQPYRQQALDPKAEITSKKKSFDDKRTVEQGMSSAGTINFGKPIGASNSDSLKILDDVKSGAISAKTIVTPAERAYISKLFPKFKDEIEKHELFTRSGEVRNTSYDRGLFIDGRA